MFFVELLQWWYGRGYKHLIASLKRRIGLIATSFSVALLLRTLFAPWRRIITYGGDSLQDRLKAVLDNLVSRLVGGAIRTIVLVSAGLIMVLISFGGAILAIVWPLLPPLAVVLVIRGFLPW